MFIMNEGRKEPLDHKNKCELKKKNVKFISIENPTLASITSTYTC